MAELSHARILWMKKDHSVEAGVEGRMRVMLEVTNASDAGESWAPGDVVLGARLNLPDGRTISPVSVEGGGLPATVVAGATFQQEIRVLADVSADDVTPAELFHLDTLIVCGVRRGTTWLGGEVGQSYVRDSLRDRVAGSFRELAARLRMQTPAHGTAFVPTSGDEVDILFSQIPSNKTIYMKRLRLSATADVQTVIFYVKRADSAEFVFDEFHVPVAPTQAYDLDELRFDPGDWFRLAVLANPRGGRAVAHLDFVDLPWEER